MIGMKLIVVIIGLAGNYLLMLFWRENHLGNDIHKCLIYEYVKLPWQATKNAAIKRRLESTATLWLWLEETSLQVV